MTYIRGMSSLTFDTLKFANRLKEAGVPAAHAEAEAAALADVFEADLSSLVTKNDLAIAVAELKAEILKWVIGLIGLQTITIISVMLKLAH